MFSCQCLNVTIAVNDESTVPTNTTTTDPGSVMLKICLPRLQPDTIARLTEGKSRELASFFQEVSKNAHLQTRPGFIHLAYSFLCLVRIAPSTLGTCLPSSNLYTGAEKEKFSTLFCRPAIFI
uniref:Uncharacterized protein n=1 Tax=Anopheles culicifacies TaxID=139723 RepID=A0A182M1B0_9DIPT